MRRWLALFAATLVVPSVAFAHPDVDAGVASYEEGEFDDALAAFEQALEGETMTRDDFVTLLEHRALVHHAMGDGADMEADLLRLASLEPDHDLAAAAPPPVRSAFDRVRRQATEPLHVDVSQDAEDDSVRLRARVAGDTAGMAEELRFAARAAGDEEYREADGTSLQLPVGIGGDVEYYATVLGPGGVVLAADGTVRRPSVLTVGEVEEEPEQTPILGGDGDDGPGAGLWIGLSLGIIAAAAAATIVIILVTQQDDDQLELGSPMVEWP